MALNKCACIDTLFTEAPWNERFQAAKNAGFTHVEFWDWRNRDLNATRAAAEAAGSGISGFNGDADYSLVDPEHRQPYLRELRRRGRGRALGREFEELEEALAAGKKIGRQKTAVYLKNLMSALERI